MKKFIALVVLLCVVLVSSTAAAAADWTCIYSDKYGMVYVDENSIRRDDNYHSYVFHAFTKHTYSEEGRNREIEKYRSNNRPLPRGIYNLSHDINLHYFKEENGIKYIDTLNCISYTRDGNTISERSFSVNSHQWTVIPPDSIGEEMYFAIFGWGKVNGNL